MTLRFDGWRNGHLSADLLTWRGINNALHGRGTADIFLGQLEFKEYLFAKVCPYLSSIKFSISIKNLKLKHTVEAFIPLLND